MSFSRLDACLRESTGLEAGVPGAVILVRLGDRRVFHEAYGFARTVPRTQRMTRDTLFDLASLTKPVCTGLLLMKFWQEGTLALEQPLSAWFPSLEDPVKERITLRELLCNRSGLPAWRPFYQGVNACDCPVPREEVRRRVLAEPLEAPPGTRETYSDLGFMLLGWILEKQAGKALQPLFREKIAKPLGLSSAAFRGIGSDAFSPGEEVFPVAATEECPWRGRVLQGEVHDENCYLLGGAAGHAGLFSTAGDLDRVVEEIFRGKKARSGTFPAEGLRTFFRRPSPSSGGSWALGWDTPTVGSSTSGRYFSNDSFGHTGFTGTSLWIDLARDIAVILLTNRIHPSRDNNAIRAFRPKVHDLVMEELLGSRSRGNDERSSGKEAKKR